MKMNENQIEALLVSQILENMAKENDYIHPNTTVSQLASYAYRKY